MTSMSKYLLTETERDRERKRRNERRGREQMNGWNRERKMEKKRNEKGGGTNERTNERWRKNELEIIKKAATQDISEKENGSPSSGSGNSSSSAGLYEVYLRNVERWMAR